MSHDRTDSRWMEGCKELLPRRPIIGHNLRRPLANGKASEGPLLGKGFLSEAVLLLIT
jgi:hypothetical protein